MIHVLLRMLSVSFIFFLARNRVISFIRFISSKINLRLLDHLKFRTCLHYIDLFLVIPSSVTIVFPKTHLLKISKVRELLLLREQWNLVNIVFSVCSRCIVK